MLFIWLKAISIKCFWVMSYISITLLESENVYSVLCPKASS